MRKSILLHLSHHLHAIDATSARRRAQAKLETPREKAARKERESKLTKEELNQERIAEAQKTNFGTKDEGGAGCVCAVQ